MSHEPDIHIDTSITCVQIQVILLSLFDRQGKVTVRNLKRWVKNIYSLSSAIPLVNTKEIGWFSF